MPLCRCPTDHVVDWEGQRRFDGRGVETLTGRGGRQGRSVSAHRGTGRCGGRGVELAIIGRLWFVIVCSSWTFSFLGIFLLTASRRFLCCSSLFVRLLFYMWRLFCHYLVLMRDSVFSNFLEEARAEFEAVIMATAYITVFTICIRIDR